MDEKGFLVGITSRSKRIFSKRLYERKEVTKALQDGSREWTTLLACICADGTKIPPAIIYQGKGALRSGWVEDVEVNKHNVFVATSPSGWSNDNLGLAWLEQVFDRSTRKKARSSYRLLILDGHGSHLTMDFIEHYGDKGPELEPKGNKSSGIQLRKLFNATVKDQTDEARKELSASIHSLQAHNDILNTENEGLRQALTLKKKHKKKSKPLDLQQRKEYHGGAVFWSPSKLREARVHEQVNRQEEEAEKLQKAQTKELKAAAALYKKKIAEEAKVLRESAKEARAEERKKAAEEAAARRTQKEQEKRDRDSQKALQQSQRGKRAASKPPKGRQEERRSNNRGWAIPPFIIFKGHYHLSAWYKEEDLSQNWIIAVSDNGWTTNKLGL
ncbi:hypothetical protein PtrM4_100160 [Pyrenophora tritici-repentis]|uniref:DDE-1 domain-containing protein n=1 Tax=Pyrenophora tritici-repentis TaxID=45151 RepID=A0A834RUQ3_9PLEO|nr:hypothetical protein PtrM4_100160 [Pyrenophora tritici-repentis]